MFDWNGNGKIDTDDHAFTAFLIDEMNRKNKEKDRMKSGFPEENDTDEHNASDYSNGKDDY